MSTNPNRFSAGFLAAAACLTFAGCSSSVAPGDAGRDGNVTDTPSIPDSQLPDTWLPPDVVPIRDVPTIPDVMPPTCSFAGATSVQISFTGFAIGGTDCSGTRPPPPGGSGDPITRTATVVETHDDSTGSHVSLDFCSPAADCVQQIGTVTIQAPGFTFGQAPNALRPGQYVRLRSRATWTWGCTMQVEISNAPAWDGVANTIRSDSALLAAAASGEPQALPDTRFTVQRQSIGCRQSGTDCGGGPPELFGLAFQGSCVTCFRQPDPVLVFQGMSGQFSIDGNTYIAVNHRSYNTGACDDYWNYAWTVREVWLD